MRGEPPLLGSVPLSKIKEVPQRLLVTATMRRHSKTSKQTKMPSMNMKAGSHQTLNPPAFQSQPSQPPDCEKSVGGVYKPPNLWYFVIAAQTG